MSIAVAKVNTVKDKKQFIDFPHYLYDGDAHYVPELYLSIKDLLNEKKNPFYKHSTAELYLARKDGKIVGRIAGIINNRYNEYHGSNIGFFGFFDCINDQQVANALLDTAFAYVKKHNKNEIHGPTNLTTNDTAGVLIDGFDGSPVYGMTYNFPYYHDLLTNYGLTKAMDLYAYLIPTYGVNEKSLKIAGMLEQRLAKEGITFRSISKKTLNQDLLSVKKIYWKAWEKNWGFVPPTDEEFDILADGLKLILDYDFIYVAEKNGEMIGFGTGIPNINEITKNFKKGRLFPFNIIKLLTRKKKTKMVRVILLGVLEEYRQKGIAAIFFANFITNARKRNLVGGEASWVLENNEMMTKAAENLNGEKYRTYRIYSHKLS